MRLDSKQLREQSGYSLLEILVAMFLVGIMAVATLPSVANMSKRQRAREAIRQVANAMQLARMRAISQNTNHVVLFENDTYNIFLDEDQDGEHDAGEEVVFGANKTLPPGVHFSFPDGDSSSVAESLPVYDCKCAEFQTTGIMVDALGDGDDRVIALGDGTDFFRRISITLGGAVSIRKWDAGTLQWK